MLTLGQSLVDLLRHDLLQPLIHFALTVPGESSISTRDPVTEKGHVAQHRSNEENESEYPNDQSESHGTEDDGLLVVFLGKSLNVLEELRKGAFNACRLDEKFTLIDGFEGERIDDLTRSRANENAKPTYI